VLVRVREGIAALDAREGLVVGQRVQRVAVEVVKARPTIVVGAALGRHHHARQAAVLGAVGVGENRDLRHRIEAGSRIANRAEDGVRRCLPVLHVRHAVGLSTEELDIRAAPANHVGVEEQEGLDIPRVPRQVLELLLVEAAGDRLTVERNVVERVGRDRHCLTDVAEFQVDVNQRRACCPHEHARPLELLEVRCDHLDAIRPWPEVRSLVTALRVGLERARNAGRFVDDEYGGTAHDLPLRVEHRSADRAEKRLRERRCGERNECGEYGGEHDSAHGHAHTRWNVLLSFGCCQRLSAMTRQMTGMNGDAHFARQLERASVCR
jgi:hypothetical protein